MLRCAAVFSDHMVFQRRRPITIWGDAGAGEEVTALLGTDSASVTADGQGHWKLVLPSREAGGPLALILEAGGERRVFIDVMVGEVWLAGGQSNMEMPLRDCRGGRREAAGSGGRNVRFYKVPRCPVTGGELTRMEEDSRWLACSPQTSGGMSAVAWFFAVRIAESQGVTVGVVDCCWGGTSVSCWMSRERLESTRAGQAYIDSYAALMGDKTDEEYRREMDEYNARFQEWSGRVEALRSEDPHIPWETVNRICGYCPWPQPAGRESPFRPAGLYYSMLQRVCPYGLRGFIYYQGEEDVQRHRSYGEMMTCLIDLWRTDWGDVELPFLMDEFPDLLLENCCSGGGRFDPGMLFYSPQIWCSDDTDAVERLRIQEGMTMLYPLSCIGAHVSDCPNHEVWRSTPFSTRAAAALTGAFGYELDVTAISQEERELIPGQVELYHRYCGLIQSGDYYRLSRAGDGGGLDCWAVVGKDRRQALVFLFRVLNEPNKRPRRVKLQGLDPALAYTDTETGRTFPGEALLHLGLPVELPEGDFQSRVVRLTAAGPDEKGQTR